MLLEVSHLRVVYSTRKGELVAVNDVTVDIAEGESLGVVGESGSGKSTFGLALVGLVPQPGRIAGGSVKLNGEEVLLVSPERLRRIRGKDIAMVFQDPMASLNPVKKVIDHFTEAIKAHSSDIEDADARIRAEEMMTDLGIPPERLRDYPHQLSGGMKQRVMIGLGLVLDPKLLVADEPTTSLDVIIEAQILDLIKRLKNERRLAMMLITHNLGVVAEVADKIAIMYAGQIVEYAETREIFRNPLFPYTQLLLKLVPDLRKESTSLDWIPGSPPDLTLRQIGCPFAPRCPYVFERCRNEAPSMREVKAGHLVACHLYKVGES